MNKNFSEIIFNIIESNEGGFEATALGYDIFTEADSVDSLKLMLKDAVECHFADLTERPKMIRLHFVKDELIPAWRFRVMCLATIWLTP